MQLLELRGWLFDLDGVLADTARAHADAWKEALDELLERRRRREGEHGALRPFDPVEDYRRYVEGRPRSEGVRRFLASRGIRLAEGTVGDPPEAETVQGVVRAAHALVVERIAGGGIDVFPASRRLVGALVAAGRRTGVVSGGDHCRAALRAGSLGGLFYVVVDAGVAAEQGLAGTPSPDTLLYGAALLDLEPSTVAVVEGAPGGGAAGRAGGFGYVVGVARNAEEGALLEAGADVVVADLGQFGELFTLLRRGAA